MYEIGAHPGATWRRIDLQCHSPRDLSWSGSPRLPAVTPEQIETRRKWASEFVNAAVSKGLKIIALTDHHDIAFLPYVLEAAAALDDRDFHVLPGIEITCMDNVQCLALFAPGAPRAKWERLLSKLPEIVVAPDADDRIAQVRECGSTIEQLFEAVLGDPQLRETVILLPHFGNENAHKSLNAAGFSSRSKKLNCDGVYVECPYDSLDPGTVDKIQGKIDDWGTRRRAILVTGDNKRASWDRLGGHECWIKLGEVSLEGLRQAFLADEARIAYAEPAIPSDTIKEMAVKSTLTGDVPVRITFNAGFTSVIGGRGSGKSSVLEYLRFGLGKAEADLKFDETDAVGRRQRERRLIESTLETGWVELLIDRDGSVERWRRAGEQPDIIKVTLSDGKVEELNIATAQQRFPARAFHQKELSTTMVVADAASENITGIAAAEFVEQRRKIDQDILNAKRELTTALQRLAGHWQAELELSQARGIVADLNRRIEALASRLQEGGVQHADMILLADSPRYGRADNFLKDVQKILVHDRSALADLVKSVLIIDDRRYSDALGFEPLKRLRDTIIAQRIALVEHIDHGLTVIDGLDTALEAAKAEFDIDFGTFTTSYSAARERQTAHRALIEETEKLTGTLKGAEAAVSIAADAESTKRPAITDFATTSKLLQDLVESRSEVLKQAAEQVADRSDGWLKARVKRDRKPKEYVESLSALFDGSRFRDPEIHCSDWIERITHNDSNGWLVLCSSILEIYRLKILAGSPAEPGTDLAERIRLLFSAGVAALTPNMVSKLYSNLSDQSVGVVISAVPKSSIMLTYVSDGQDINFDEASPGQQASALLRLLLRQEAGTLIIDQPEDDLDNRVLMDVVKLVRSSKSKRQLIFATHNPNLVVNGDADKVITMIATVPEDRAGPDAPRVKIQDDGAIETSSVRGSITSIMEGGSAAFELRAKKLGMSFSQ